MANEPDWRTAVFTHIAEEVPESSSGHPAIPAGSRAVTITLGTAMGGRLVSFPQPSAPAMALNIAARAAEEAVNLQESIEFRNSTFDGHDLRTVPGPNVSTLFDFFEQCMIAATFSFQALEAYCNLTIDRHVKDTFTWKDRDGNPQQMTTLEMERSLSTEAKLGELLPVLLNMTTPKGKAVWQNFKLLKKKRDACVHVKSSDQSPRPKEFADVHKTSLFTGFIGETITDWPQAAVKMINYFDRREVQWPWLQHELDRFNIPRNAGS